MLNKNEITEAKQLIESIKNNLLNIGIDLNIYNHKISNNPTLDANFNYDDSVHNSIEDLTERTTSEIEYDILFALKTIEDYILKLSKLKDTSKGRKVLDSILDLSEVKFVSVEDDNDNLHSNNLILQLTEIKSQIQNLSSANEFEQKVYTKLLQLKSQVMNLVNSETLETPHSL